ncbi:MAG: Ig domain-containing protein, partial [Candidatus Methanomethylophilaceae archaeon]|nr:Ig domain-containing protein [Candidatus Methanomethylophilaceae archaeon]
HYQNLVWTSSDESVATVEDGVVKAVGHGVATVSVRAEGWEPVAECTVSVLAPSTDVEVEPGVSGGVATVDPSDVSEALGGSVDGPVNIVVNASDLAVKSVVIDADSVRSMADAGASVTFGTANGAVTLDPQTLASLADAGELSIVVDHEPVLTDVQADFVGQDHKSFEIIVSVGGTERSTFGNGMLDVFLPYDMDGRDERYVGFYHVADSGAHEPVDFDFVEGGITATLRHLSVYSIVYGEDVAVTGVTLNKSSMTLVAGGSETLVEEVLPAKAAVRTVTWTSSDPSVASVDFKGRVVALKAGTAVVTVTTVDGGFTASCTVFVASQGTDVPVTGVALDRDSLTMAPGDTGSLVATVSPSDATLNGVSWASSDPSVVKVDPYGRITALGDGTAVVTVTTVDGGFTASCTVTVESESAGSDTGTVPIVVAAIAIVAAAVAAVVLLRRRS